MIDKWESVRKPIETLAKSKQILPFLGAAVSYFQPTNLPLGSGLLRAALQGMFPSRNLFVSDEYEWAPEEVAINRHSPEVILQGLAEGLLDRGKLASLYNAMTGIPPNQLHHVLSTALLSEKVPAIFTTNQDQCIEAAAAGHLPIIYDKKDFNLGLRQGLFQFHGAIGGDSPEESAKRKQSLTFTLHAMGPHLTKEHGVLLEAVSKYTLLFLGYSGSDPDIWYSLSKILQTLPDVRIYWCIRDKPSRHLLRLQSRNRKSIIIFRGNIIEVLKRLSVVWDIGDFGAIEEPTTKMQEERLRAIQMWATDLSDDERDLAYGWLLVSIGQHTRGAEELEGLLERSRSNRHIHMLAALFAGYAKREMSDHITARKHLRMALEESEDYDQCRHAQAVHKLGESFSAFESVRFWYFWPTIPQIHPGARLLLQAIEEYKNLPPEELAAKQMGRAGLGTAQMNLGQLYRRTAAYTPYIRAWLANKARETIDESIEILKDKEKDFRALPMAIAAAVADDPAKRLDEKIEAINLAIEYSEEWNQDEIQIGAAYFMKAQLLAKVDPQMSATCYLKALSAFKTAGMKAEIARTEIDLITLAAHTIDKTQGSIEWKIGLRMRGVAKILLHLAPREIALALVGTLVVIAAMVRARKK